MATEASKFKVGAFLIAGFLVFNAALIWVGASRLLEEKKNYVTYFAESVQGLDVGSPVKYRGVPLGRVSAIRVAPDGRLVEVDMEIDPRFRVLSGMRATLASVGITGATFVELRFAAEGAPAQAPPKIDFPVPQGYIPSQRSFLTNLLSTLSDVATRLQGTDIPGLVAEYRALAVTARQKLAAPEVDRTLDRISRAADALEGSARRISTLLKDPRLTQSLDRVASATQDLQGAAHSAKALMQDPRIEETLTQVQVTAEGLHRFTEEIGAQASDLRAGERLDAVQRRIDGVLDEFDAAAKTAGAGARSVADSAGRIAARWDRLSADLDRSLREDLARLGRAADRLNSLASSLEANPSRLLLERPPRRDFR